MFSIVRETTRSFSIAGVTSCDGKDYIEFDASGYSNASAKSRDRETGRLILFDEMNLFLRTKLTKEDRSKLFQIYARIDELFSDTMLVRFSDGEVSEMFDLTLMKLVSKIFDIIKFSEARKFILELTRTGVLSIPGDIRDTHVTEDRLTPKYLDCTYLREDYIDLVTLCFVLRTMVPIWGRYMPLKRHDVSVAMKEYHAFRLLSTSNIYREAAFDRLETYVLGVMDNKPDIGIILAGLSDDEIPQYLMALTVVRKLTLAPIDGSNESHLIREIFHYLNSKNGDMGRTLGSPIRQKREIMNEWSEEDNSSIWDIYKMRESISAADISITEVYLSDYCQGDSPSKTKECYSTIIDKNISTMQDCQLTLISWIMATLIPGTTVALLESKVLKRAMAIAQSQLWEWGFGQLAILLTANVIPLEEHVYVGSSEIRPITADRRAMLEKIYPTIPREDGSMENVGITSISRLSKTFYGSDWSMDCSKELARTVEGMGTIQIFEAPRDLQNMLADLLFKLNND